MLYVSILFFISIFVLCFKVLIQIRDEIRFGVVINDFRDFVQQLNAETNAVVYKKSLFNYQLGRWAYTTRTKNGLVTYINYFNLDDQLPSNVAIVGRSFKLR